MCNTLALNLFHDRFAREFWCPARGFSAASPSQQVVASGRSGGLFSFSFHPAPYAQQHGSFKRGHPVRLRRSPVTTKNDNEPWLPGDQRDRN